MQGPFYKNENPRLVLGFQKAYGVVLKKLFRRCYQVEILDMLTDLNKKYGTTIVMVLHDINLSANLHYTIRGIQSFKNKSLLISGGGNSAIDWAKDLIGIAKHITVIYRGENLSAHEAQIRYLEENGVPIVTSTQIKSLVANEEKTKIKEVVLENVKTNEISTLVVDDVLVNHGYDRDHSFAFDAAVNPQRDSEYQYYLTTNGKGLTTVDGIYAVGDISKHDNKVYLITGAFQDAINDIKLSLEPTADKYAKVSSHNEVFEARNREIINKL